MSSHVTPLPAMKVRTPVDQEGRAPTVLAFDTDTTPGKISTSSTTANAAVPGEIAKAKDGTLIVRVAATEDCYIKWGADVSVEATANDSLFPKGVEPMRVPIGMHYLAAIRVTTDGVLTITVME